MAGQLLLVFNERQALQVCGQRRHKAKKAKALSADAYRSAVAPLEPVRGYRAVPALSVTLFLEGNKKQKAALRC